MSDTLEDAAAVDDVASETEEVVADPTPAPAEPVRPKGRYIKLPDSTWGWWRLVLAFALTISAIVSGAREYFQVQDRLGDLTTDLAAVSAELKTLKVARTDVRSVNGQFANFADQADANAADIGRLRVAMNDRLKLLAERLNAMSSLDAEIAGLRGRVEAAQDVLVQVRDYLLKAKMIDGEPALTRTP